MLTFNFRLLLLIGLFVSVMAVGSATQEPTTGTLPNSDGPLSSAEATPQETTTRPPSVDPPDESCWWLGLACTPTPDVLNAQLNIAGGLAIFKLANDAPAVQAGFQVHDVVLSINGHGVREVTELDAQIRAAKGTTIEVEILRNGTKSTISVAPVRRRPCGEAETMIIEVNSDQEMDAVKLQELEEFLKAHSGDTPAQVIIVRPGVKLRRLANPINESQGMSTSEADNSEELVNLNLRLEQLDLEGALLSVVDWDQRNEVSGCPHRLAEKIDQAIARRKAELQELMQANANIDQVVNSAVSDHVPTATLKRLRLRISEVESYLETLEEARMLLQRHFENQPNRDPNSKPAETDQSCYPSSGRLIWS